MQANEIAALVTKLLLGEWKSILGVLTAIILSTISITWYLSHLWYKREIRILESHLEESEKHLNRTKDIMNHQIEMAQNEVINLRKYLEATKTKFQPPANESLETNDLMVAENSAEYKVSSERTDEKINNALKFILEHTKTLSSILTIT